MPSHISTSFQSSNLVSGNPSKASLSTINGIITTRQFNVEHSWNVQTIDPKSKNNMSLIYKSNNIDQFETLAVIIIDAVEDLVAKAYMSYDDFSQLWVNGYKYHYDSNKTADPRSVKYEIPIQLNKGANVLLYNVADISGNDYFNLHFELAF